jgi:membrane dipeptidase
MTAHAPNVPVIDCHSDVSVDVYRRRLEGESSVLSRIHAPAYEAGGVVAAVVTVGGDTGLAQLDGSPYENTLTLLDALETDIGESDGAFAIAATADEVRALIAKDVFAIVLAIEGAAPVEGDLGKLEDLHDRGVRVIGLTWNSRNEIGVGVGSGEGGLTEFGGRAVTRMNELGILVDLSHSTTTTFWDVATVTGAPLYASHSNARALRDHPRNVDDKQLGAIADTGGAVGLVAYADFISDPPVDLDGLLRHLDHFREKVGDNHIVFGADFLDYAIEDTLELARTSPSYNEMPEPYATGLGSVGSTQNLVEAMRKHNVPAGTISGVASENFLRLLATTQALGAAR